MEPEKRNYNSSIDDDIVVLMVDFVGKKIKKNYFFFSEITTLVNSPYTY